MFSQNESVRSHGGHIQSHFILPGAHHRLWSSSRLSEFPINTQHFRVPCELWWNYNLKKGKRNYKIKNTQQTQIHSTIVLYFQRNTTSRVKSRKANWERGLSSAWPQQLYVCACKYEPGHGKASVIRGERLTVTRHWVPPTDNYWK